MSAAAAGAQTKNTTAAANTPALVIPANFHSRWVSQSSDLSLPGGSSTTLMVRFRNTGTASWIKGVPGQQANLAVSGEGANLASGWPTADRLAVQLEDVVAPGEVATFEFDVRVPSVATSYRLDVRPVIDGTTWLENDGVFFTLTSQGVPQHENLTAFMNAFASILESFSAAALGVFGIVVLGLLFLLARLVPRRRRAHPA